MSELAGDIIKHGQFPYGRRKYQYQSIEDEGMAGIRDMEHRYSILDLPSFHGKTVLDIGCSLGMVCVMASKLGANKCVGIDNNSKTLETARRYINSKGYKNISLILYDVNQGITEEIVSLIGYPMYDCVFALSIFKHVNKKSLFDLIKFYTRESCWFEGHNKQDRKEATKILHRNLGFKKIEFLGYSTDRGVRPNFKIIR